MSILRLVDDNIVDFFVQKAEGFCYGIYELLKDSPYLLRNRYLDRLLRNLPEISPTNEQYLLFRNGMGSIHSRYEEGLIRASSFAIS